VVAKCYGLYEVVGNGFSSDCVPHLVGGIWIARGVGVRWCTERERERERERGRSSMAQLPNLDNAPINISALRERAQKDLGAVLDSVSACFGRCDFLFDLDLVC
jgi:hypothetical protein